VGRTHDKKQGGEKKRLKNRKKIKGQLGGPREWLETLIIRNLKGGEYFRCLLKGKKSPNTPPVKKRDTSLHKGNGTGLQERVLERNAGNVPGCYKKKKQKKKGGGKRKREKVGG